MAFTIESVYNSVLIYYIYTTHAIVVKLDNVRTRREAVVLVAKSFVLLITLRTLLLFNICCLKENRLAVVPFATNEIYRIVEITFTPGHFLIFFQFRHQLSIWAYCSYSVNSILKDLIVRFWAATKFSKIKVQ